MIELNAKVGTIPMRIHVLWKRKAPAEGDRVKFRDATLGRYAPIREGVVTRVNDYVTFISLL